MKKRLCHLFRNLHQVNPKGEYSDNTEKSNQSKLKYHVPDVTLDIVELGLAPLFTQSSVEKPAHEIPLLGNTRPNLEN